jgi:AMP nucleosidase
MTEQQEADVAKDALERYSGSEVGEYRSYILITNFGKYVDYFAATRGLKIKEGAMFKVAHSEKEDISILDFKIGSPAAALVIDVCSFLPFKACLLLGMCGGLREHYKIGEYLVPVASIRGDGTSDFYFPPEVPALANFVVQKAVTNILEIDQSPYHIGITHTTNKRFWEFNPDFKNKLRATNAQAIEMECATLFLASYKRRFPLGALLLISDLPLSQQGIKTKKSSEQVFEGYTADHVEKGVRIIESLKGMHHLKIKGTFRGESES